MAVLSRPQLGTMVAVGVARCQLDGIIRPSEPLRRHAVVHRNGSQGRTDLVGVVLLQGIVGDVVRCVEPLG